MVEVGHVHVVGDQRPPSNLHVQVRVHRDALAEHRLVANPDRAFVRTDLCLVPYVHPRTEDDASIPASAEDLGAAP